MKDTPEQSADARALLAIRKLRAEIDRLKAGAHEPVAIVGMACRFPGGSDTPEAFWANLAGAVDCTSDAPPDRWSTEAWYDPDPEAPRKMITKHGGFIDAIDRFDAAFFNISGREAAAMDPQHRILLETAWEAIDNAGYDLARLRQGPTGVYVGVSTNDYTRLSMSASDELLPYGATGCALSIVANRLSYTLDLSGPSLALDTACSSSLVAAHLACDALRRREVDTMLVCGVNILISPYVMSIFSKMGALCPDGRCKTFDASANGYARGEGCGVLVLKRLSDAEASGDRIWGVIRGSAVNQDGRSAGLTAPNGLAQERVIREALRSAGLSGQAVRYVEAHGTGTVLGDPIEVEALNAVYGEREGTCALGSVKTNIGHLEPAAGVAGLIKVALSLSHRRLPASLHYRRANPHIAFDTMKLRVQTELGEWPQGEGDLVAGVSSFGFGGTNAHLIVGEAPREDGEKYAFSDAEAAKESVVALGISGKSEGAMRAQAEQTGASLSAGVAWGNYRDAGYTSLARREPFEHRAVALGKSASELGEKLTALGRGDILEGVTFGRVRGESATPVVFVFGGQGSQWLGMCGDLVREEAVFRDEVRRVSEAIRAHGGVNVEEELARDEATSRLSETEVAQSVLFALQAGLAAQWRSYGIEPRAVVGHSVGEIAAFYVAGVLSLSDASRLAVHRGRLMQRATGRGRMMATELPGDEARDVLKRYAGRLWLGGENGPKQTVLSGEESALREVMAELDERGIYVKDLGVKYAFHSGPMAEYADALEKELVGLAPQAGSVRVVSTVRGDFERGERLGARYWRDQMVSPVLFDAAIQRLLGEGSELFLEIGPHAVLCGSMAERFSASGSSARAVASQRRGKGAKATLLEAAGALWCEGASVDWGRVYGGEARAKSRVVPLPGYAWQRESYWIDEAESVDGGSMRSQLGFDRKKTHPLLEQSIDVSTPSATAAARGHVWQSVLDLKRVSFIEDHQFETAILVPGATYTEMAVAAGRELYGEAFVGLENVAFSQMLTMKPGGATTIQAVVAGTESETGAFHVASRPSPEARWTVHASATLRHAAEVPAAPPPIDLDAWRAGCTETVSGRDFYASTSARGLDYGPRFQSVASVVHSATRSLTTLAVPPKVRAQMGHYHVHPAVLDACWQAMAAVLPKGPKGEPIPFLPTGFGALRVHGDLRQVAFATAELSGPPTADGVLRADMFALDANGRVLVETRGFSVKRLDREEPAEHAKWTYAVEWEARPATSKRRDGRGAWLVLADASGLGEALAAEMTAHGEKCVLARTGTKLEGSRAEGYVFEPGEAEHYRVILKDLESNGGCRGIVHLLSLDASREGMSPLESLLVGVKRGSVSTLLLLQTLSRIGFRDAPGVWVVTRGVQASKAGKTPLPGRLAQSPVWGLGASVAHELPEVPCALVDLDPSSGREESLAQLLHEIHATDGEDRIAYSSGTRKVARLKKLAAASRGARVLRADRTYLVTGGLGGLGLATARAMFEQGGRNFALVARRPPGPVQAASIASLEASGAVVKVFPADMGDPRQVAAMLEAVERDMPPVAGVVYAAGAFEGSNLLQMSPEHLTGHVVWAKLAGAYLVHEWSEKRELEFFDVYSSCAGVLGSRGQANYAAANATLDALARLRAERGLPAFAVAWGPWAEIGMAASDETSRANSAAGFGAMPPDDALHAYRDLQGVANEACVMSLNLEHWAQSHQRAAGRPFIRELIQSVQAAHRKSGPSQLQLRLAALPPEEWEGTVESMLRAELARALRIPADAIQPARPLSELGMDSITVVEFRNRVHESTGVPLQIGRVFGRATLKTLTAGILAELAPAEAAPAPAEAAAPPPAEAVDMDALEDALASGELADDLADLLGDDDDGG